MRKLLTAALHCLATQQHSAPLFHPVDTLSHAIILSAGVAVGPTTALFPADCTNPYQRKQVLAGGACRHMSRPCIETGWRLAP